MALKARIATAGERISRNRQAIRSVSALLGSRMTSSVLTAVGGFFIARFLGPEETGAFRAFTIPLTYLAVLHLGTNDGLWRQIPYHAGKNNPERVESIASVAGAFMLSLSVVISFGFTCLAVFSLFHDNFYGFFGWLAQAVFCWEVFYGSYLMSTYRTMDHFVTMARAQVVRTVLTFGMVFLLPFIKFYGLCARLSLPSGLLVWLYHRHRPIKVPYRFDMRILKELLGIGFPYSCWGSIYTSAWIATESALILSWSGVTALGLFSVAYLLRSAVNSLPQSIYQVLTPRVVTAFAEDGSIRSANRRIVWVTAGLTGFMVVFAMGGALLLDLLVPTLIPKYAAGIPIMKVALWFPVVEAAFLPMNTLFATGRPWLYGRSVIPGVIVFVSSTYLMLPSVGGLPAVVMGSLFGRAARTIAAYVDLYLLTRNEALAS